ncbi:MAG: YggT family protein [Gemmatimonadetes bacterium]|nr:YggT family protein [Gemmatimonadota bacterium]
MLYVLLQVIDFLRTAVDFVAFAAVVAVVVLMVLRWILFKTQPFGRLSQVVREWTDPMIWPVAQSLPASNSLSIAPLFVVLATLLAAFFLKWVSNDVLLALEGVLRALLNVAFLQVIGWLFYGAISVFLVLILARIIVSWMPFLRNGRLIWTLYALTEPVMAPFRRMIPPLGMFDLSPILLILLLNFAKGAVLAVFGLGTS